MAARAREVTLEQRKGIWTLEEVHALCASCGVPPPAGVKGVWTLEEVVAALKAEGLRVWGTDLPGGVHAVPGRAKVGGD